MSGDIKQLRSLLGGLSYYRKFLPNMAKRVKSITSLLKKGAVFDFTPTMETAVRALLAELAAPPTLVFPDWDAVIDKSRPFRLHCDASTDGLVATLEQEQPDGSIRPIVYISRATLSNERNWTPWTSRPDALCGVSVAYAVTYLAFFFSDFHRSRVPPAN